MPRRKLLFYMHALEGGGAERVVALLASGFARRGFEVILAVDAEARQNTPYLSADVRTVILGRGHARTTFRLARLLSRERPDISISALGASNLKHALACLAAGRTSRAVLTNHGFRESEPQRLSRLGNGMTPLTSRLCARTVCVSAVLRRHVVETWACDPARTVVIPNPVAIDEAVPARSEAELVSRLPMVLAAGRLIPLKGFMTLLRAFADVRSSDARLVILGEGPQRAEMEAEIRRLGLGERVQLPGYVDNPWAYFRAARCFALSSVAETFGNVIVEALAHGLPVVATRCGGAEEVLGDDLGQLVQVGDEAALTEALGGALARPGDPSPRVRRARAFSVDVALDQYEWLITEIIAQI